MEIVIIKRIVDLGRTSVRLRNLYFLDAKRGRNDGLIRWQSFRPVPIWEADLICEIEIFCLGCGWCEFVCDVFGNLLEFLLHMVSETLPKAMSLTYFKQDKIGTMPSSEEIHVMGAIAQLRLTPCIGLSVDTIPWYPKCGVRKVQRIPERHAHQGIP